MLAVSLRPLPAKSVWATTIDATFEGGVGNMVVSQWESLEKVRHKKNTRRTRTRTRLDAFAPPSALKAVMALFDRLGMSMREGRFLRKLLG